jgi:hypothetical protein
MRGLPVAFTDDADFVLRDVSWRVGVQTMLRCLESYQHCRGVGTDLRKLEVAIRNR